jgi:hypothetical protein
MENWKMIGLIPASGKATRFNGLPKFSLPCDFESTPVIKRQVNQMKECLDTVVISTSNKWYELVKSFDLDVEIMIIEPSTMNDSVLRMSEAHSSDSYIIGMADTYFKGENPYINLSNAAKNFSVSIACWKINDSLKGKVGQVNLVKNSILDLQDKEPKCEYGHMWGAIGLSKDVVKTVNALHPHLGIKLLEQIKGKTDSHYAFEVDGEYFDIGSMANYKNLLNSLEI